MGKYLAILTALAVFVGPAFAQEDPAPAADEACPRAQDAGIAEAEHDTTQPAAGEDAAPASSEETPSEAEQEPEEIKGPILLRLLTYNIHHGEGTDEKFDLWRIADLIKAQNPDLVAVQEVDVKTRRAKGTDQASKLAELTGMNYVFGKFMDYSGGEYGQMVLSKLPIKSSENHPLPPGPEPRTALEVRVDVPIVGGRKQEIVFVGNHLYATEAQRLAQARRLMELFGDEPVPVILAGDFNSSPLQPPMALLEERWVDPTLGTTGHTWPSDEPKIEIDYVLFAPEEAFRFVSSTVIDETVASDHRPVLTVLELLPRD